MRIPRAGSLVPRIAFTSFRARIVVFFLGLLTLMQILAFIVVDAANTQDAQAQVNAELLVGGRVFNRLIRARTQQLGEAARLLSGDYAFKTVYATQDAGTILSALENHQARIGADVMMLVSLDGVVERGPPRRVQRLRQLDAPEVGGRHLHRLLVHLGERDVGRPHAGNDVGGRWRARLLGGGPRTTRQENRDAKGQRGC